MSRMDWAAREQVLAKSHARQMCALISIGIPFVLLVAFLVA